ncbi:MAG: metallophosphoesterase [Lentisphaeria bacterium]|nr:metallophosphoesterase [Lentisphaeria bacterium]
MSVESSVWVVGDIHGMLDPLKMLLNTIRSIESTRERRVVVVFLGDYIDHGPCSKEVIDTILDLAQELPVVCLAGNHEDMLLHFLNGEPDHEEVSRTWFGGNGAQATICSFMNNRQVLQRLWMKAGDTVSFSPGELRLEPKYLDFFRGLHYAHTEVLRIGREHLRLAFTHASLYRRSDGAEPDDTRDRDIPIEEQLICRTRREFQALCQRYPLWMKDYHIWNRDLPRTCYGAFLHVHGHTPTVMLEQIHPGRLGRFKPESGLPFVVFPEGKSVSVTRNGRGLDFGAHLRDVAAINIDTGSMYGQALTALNFSTHRLRSDPWVGVVQVHDGLPQKDYGACCQFYLCFRGL